MKEISFELQAETIVFFQTLFGLVCLLPFAWTSQVSVWRSNRMDLQIFRVFFALVGMLLWCKAVSALPIGQAVALNFTGPLITICGSILFLKESMTVYRFLAIVLGFCGGFIVANARYLSGESAFGSESIPMLLPLGSAAAFSLCTLLNKKLTNYDPPLTIVTYLMVFMLPVLGVLAWLNGTWPSPHALGLLAILGANLAFAQFALTRSFVCADLIFLLPFGSLRLVVSALLAFIFFGQNLNIWIFGGFFAIMGALFVLARFERC